MATGVSIRAQFARLRHRSRSRRPGRHRARPRRHRYPRSMCPGAARRDRRATAGWRRIRGQSTAGGPGSGQVQEVVWHAALVLLLGVKGVHPTQRRPAPGQLAAFRLGALGGGLDRRGSVQGKSPRKNAPRRPRRSRRIRSYPQVRHKGGDLRLKMPFQGVRDGERRQGVVGKDDLEDLAILHYGDTLGEPGRRLAHGDRQRPSIDLAQGRRHGVGPGQLANPCRPRLAAGCTGARAAKPAARRRRRQPG